MSAAQLLGPILRNVTISDYGLLLEALLDKRVFKELNYDRLEFFGDRVLEIFGILQATTSQEGDMREHRTAKEQIVCNDNLGECAMTVGLGKYIMTSPAFSWIGIGTRTGVPQVHKKTQADVVEALIAVAFIEGEKVKAALANAYSAVKGLVIKEEWLDLGHMLSCLQPLPSATDEGDIELLGLEKVLGYTFRHKALRRHAVTHHPIPSDMPKYEYLVWIGRAVLNLLVSRRLLAAENNFRPRGLHDRLRELTELRVLGLLCILFRDLEAEAIGIDATIHGCLRADQATLQPLANTLRRCEQNRYFYSLVRDGFYDCFAMPPFHIDNLFGIMVEAILGAIFLDCDAELQPCNAFLGRIGLYRVMNLVLRDGLRGSMPDYHRLLEIYPIVARRPPLDY